MPLLPEFLPFLVALRYIRVTPDIRFQSMACHSLAHLYGTVVQYEVYLSRLSDYTAFFKFSDLADCLW